MSYTFLDASGTTRTADSSIVSGSTQRPIIEIGSVLSAIPIIGTTANQSVSGAVSVSNFPSNTSVSGAVSVSNLPGNQSVSGTVGASLIGLSPVSVSNFPSNTSVSGAVSVSNFPSNQSVSGTVGASLIGLSPVNVTNQVTVVSSISGGIFPISGSVAATITNTNVNVSGSVVAFGFPTTQNVSGSVAAFVVGNSSLITVAQANSIAGTYAEDAAHTTGDRGLFTLGVRNDTLASVASADGDYSAYTVGPIGEQVIANAPITKWVQGTADLRVSSGGSITAIAAQGASIFTYVTGLQVVNFGPSSVIVTLSGATSSIIGYTIAPAGGGSNIVYPNGLKTNANGAFAASISGISSVLVSAQGFISKV